MSKQTELAWIAEARKHIGLSEIVGTKGHNTTILGWLKKLGAWWAEDETPWCGTFVGYCLQFTGRFVVKHWYRAKDWVNAGTKLSKPAYGCLVIFNRAGGGHVGFVVGKDARGNLMVLGGNQNNKVSIAPFATDRVVAYVWPSFGSGVPSIPDSKRYDLPVLNSNGKVSTNEA